MKFLIFPIFLFLNGQLLASIDSGGGLTEIGQLNNTSSIGGYLVSENVSFGNYKNYNGLLNVVFIPSILVAELDGDGDGLLDSWELSHGLSVTLDDSASDFDGDGMSALAEYISGTNPNDSNSAFNLSIEYSEGGVKLIFNSNENRIYNLMLSNDLETYYTFLSINGSGTSHEIDFNPNLESVTAIFGNTPVKDFFFKLTVELVD